MWGEGDEVRGRTGGRYRVEWIRGDQAKLVALDYPTDENPLYIHRNNWGLFHEPLGIRLLVLFSHNSSTQNYDCKNNNDNQHNQPIQPCQTTRVCSLTLHSGSWNRGWCILQRNCRLYFRGSKCLSHPVC